MCNRCPTAAPKRNIAQNLAKRGKWSCVTFTILLSLAMASGGCTSRFSEMHYFKYSEPGKDDAPANYFRLTVSGSTWFASARYVSGYFDEDAVNMYFSEFSQPAKGAIFQEKQASSADTASKASTTKPLDKSLEGKSLVMILSSNSDEIATQIGAFAENERTARAIGRLINREKLLGARSSNEALRSQKIEGKKLVDLGEAYISKLDDQVVQGQAQTSLLEYLNALGASLGHDGRFATVKQASEWVGGHRSQLLRE
jgi:hypothetical protein